MFLFLYYIFFKKAIMFKQFDTKGNIWKCTHSLSHVCTSHVQPFSFLCVLFSVFICTICLLKNMYFPGFLCLIPIVSWGLVVCNEHSLVTISKMSWGKPAIANTNVTINVIQEPFRRDMMFRISLFTCPRA